MFATATDVYVMKKNDKKLGEYGRGVALKVFKLSRSNIRNPNALTFIPAVGNSN